MKTYWITLKKGGLIPMILAAVLAVTALGCEEDPLLLSDDSPSPEATYSGNIKTATFWVNPEGTRVTLFNGDISLEFPKGAVMVPSEFNLVSFPLDHLDLDGHNYYNRGYSLTGSTTYQKFMTPNIKIYIKYDLAEESWLKSVPADPGNLTILNVSPTVYAYDRVVSIGDCCTDFSCKLIKGCICQCGFYVVGEN